MKVEIIREIITLASILIKTDCDDILERKDVFIAWLNEVGVRNEAGRLLNKANLKKMLDELTDEEKIELVEEFNEGYEHIYRHLMMYSNK